MPKDTASGIDCAHHACSHLRHGLYVYTAVHTAATAVGVHVNTWPYASTIRTPEKFIVTTDGFHSTH